MFALAVVHYAAEVVSDLEALMALKVEQEMALMSFWAGSMFVIYVHLVWKVSIEINPRKSGKVPSEVPIRRMSYGLALTDSKVIPAFGFPRPSAFYFLWYV